MPRILTLNRLNLTLLLLLTLLSITIGVADFSWTQFWHSPQQMQLLLLSRLPRTAAIVLTGSSLAVAGMVLQIVLKNRFIDPGMIGAGQSAALGILIMMLLWPSAALLWKMGFATLAALLGMGVFVLLLRRLPPQQQLMVPLVGIILGYIIEAVTTFIAYQTDSLQILGVLLFSGDFSGALAGRYELLWLTALLTLTAYILADKLTITGLGRDISISLGINHAQMMWLALLLVAMMTAMVIVTVGQIPFIGLVVANIVSRLAGDRLRQNLPSVALLGANLLLVCDVLGRIINQPYEIPASMLFGVFGTVVFLYLLFKKAPRYAA